MAKKKRRIVEEPEEQYEFTPTEFNEREFILKDIYSTKVFLVAVLLGAIVGVVGAIICNHWDSDYARVVATLISFAVMGLMRNILAAVGFRPEMIELKSMIGNYLLYLAIGLGLCILFVNEPFTSIL